MRQNRSGGGFALIIALVLMGMLVLLLVALQALTQVELRTSEQYSLLSQAQNNSRLGLMIAIGRLQETAGPDRRATATLEVLEGESGSGYDDAMRFWAGVWKNNGSYDSGTNLMTYQPELTEVLVSGVSLASDGSNTIARQSTEQVEIVGAGSVDTDDLKVSVPKVLLEGESGHYAYWISDEGVKANVVTRDNSAKITETPAGNAMTDEALAALRLAIAPSYGSDQMDGMADFPRDDATLESVVLLNQLGTLDADITEAVKGRFHDVTVYSYGLLTDQRRGGLRKDLSYLLNQGAMSDLLWPQGPGFERIRHYASYALGKSEVVPTIGDTSIAGIYPVITQFYIYFNVVPVQLETGEWRFQLEVSPVIVLYNPYNIDFSSAPMRVLVDLPILKASIAYQEGDGSGTLLPREADFSLLTRLVAGEDRPRLWFDIANLTIPAGEAVMLSIRDTNTDYNESGNPLTQTATNNPGFINVKLEADDEEEPTGEPTAITWALSVPAATNTNRALRVYTRTLNTHLIYQEFLQYPALVVDPSKIAAEPSGTRAGGFAYSMAVLSSADPLPVYASFNPRARSAQQRLFSGGMIMKTDQIILPQLAADGRPFVGSVFGSNMGSPYSLSPSVTKAILFDANRYGLISLGQLQHVDLSRNTSSSYTAMHAPAHVFGNSFVNPYVGRSDLLKSTYVDHSYYSNEALWDGYYFSTVPQKEDARLPSVLSNSRLRPIPPVVTQSNDYLSAYAPAELLWIDGAFNVNSTSVEAWVALFSALREGTDGGLVSRFIEDVDAAGMTIETAAAGLSPEAWNSIRKLTDSQIVALAQAIVDEVKARGPFLSVAQFINRNPGNDDSALSGTIQAALDSTTINNSMREDAPLMGTADATTSPGVVSTDDYAGYYSGGDYYIDFLRGAPGMLTQADIMTLIGPVVSARSDTFVIRAYGDVVDPANSSNILASAWCEAVVQRYPDRLNANGEAVSEDAESGGGRRFRIVHFRWLSVDDI